MREVHPGTDDVADGVDGEDEPDPDDLHGLEDHVHLPEARQTLVPHTGQKLLDVGVSNKLRNKSFVKEIIFTCNRFHTAYIQLHLRQNNISRFLIAQP